MQTGLLDEKQYHLIENSTTVITCEYSWPQKNGTFLFDDASYQERSSPPLLGELGTQLKTLPL